MTDKNSDNRASSGDSRAVATSNAAINTTIKAIKSATTKVRALIQTGIVQCIEHGKTFGDVTGAARLIDAIPQEMRRAEVIKHFAEYSPIRVTPQGRGKPMKASLRKPDDAGYNDWNVAGVKANPWYEREAISRADQRDLAPFDIDNAEKRVLDLAHLFERKASANNSIIVGEDGEQVEKNQVVNDDRRKIRAMSRMLKMVSQDPWAAAQKLGLAQDEIDALKGVEGVTDEPATEQVEEERVAPRRTGTEG